MVIISTERQAPGEAGGAAGSREGCGGPGRSLQLLLSCPGNGFCGPPCPVSSLGSFAVQSCSALTLLVSQGPLFCPLADLLGLLACRLPPPPLSSPPWGVGASGPGSQPCRSGCSLCRLQGLNRRRAGGPAWNHAGKAELTLGGDAVLFPGPRSVGQVSHPVRLHACLAGSAAAEPLLPWSHAGVNVASPPPFRGALCPG